MKKSFTLLRSLILAALLLVGVTNVWSEEIMKIEFATNQSTPINGFVEPNYPDIGIALSNATTKINQTASNASKDYEGASGSGVALLSAANLTLTLTNINTEAFSDIALSFGLKRGKSNDVPRGNIKVEYQDVAGSGNWTELTLPNESFNTAWTLVKAEGAIPSTSNLTLKFTHMNTTGRGIDDILLTGVLANVPTITATPASLNFEAININQTTTKTVAVVGNKLSGTNILASITEGDTYFSVKSGATLPIEGGDVEISVLSTTEGNITGVLTLTDGTTTKTVTLSATIIDPAKFTVATIAELKAKGTEDKTSVYTLTGDLTVIFQKGTSLYVQDATGAMLIYGNAIKKEYAEGAVITGGLKGTLTEYNGLFQLIPTEDMAEGTGSASITPTEATIAQLKATPKNYESQLVKIKDVTFAAATFTSNNVNISVEEDIMVCRNGFYTVTGPLPSTAHITGLITIYKTDVQIFPRNNDDIQSTVSLSDLTTTTNIFASNGVLNIKLTSAQTITIYNIQGQALIQTTGKEGWNQINLSNKGIVVVKVDNNMTKVML